MDIISLGAATKAGMEENKTRKQTLELGVNGAHASVAKRLEMLETSYLSGVKKANELIVKDTINIMKAHARLNAIAQSKKYKMENMIFDDLLDMSGIDTAKSNGYTHDAISGTIKASGTSNYMIVTAPESADAPPSKIILTAEENQTQQKLVTSSVGGNSSSNGTQGGNYPYWSIFNNGGGDWWENGTSYWVAYDFKTPVAIDSYILRQNPYSAKNWTFEGWNGTAWVVLHTVTNEPLTTDASEKRTYVTGNRTAYTKYRLNVTACHSGGKVRIYELAFYPAYIPSAQALGAYSISLDDGATWKAIEPNKLSFFDEKLPTGTKLRLKAQFASNVQLLNYALTWA